MRPCRGTLALPVNGESMRVSGIPHLRCPACGEKLVNYEQARALDRTAMDLYRAKHSLLSAEEIRALRERLGLTQVELAGLLRLGANTISRWEAGRYVQSSAMDVLLRLIRDVPAGLAYLRGHAA